MARKIVVTSGKGGVGKTSLTAMLGFILAKNGQKVLLIDGDTRLNNLDVVIGVEDKIVFDIYDAINNKCTIKDALVSPNNVPNLYLLSSKKALNYTNATNGEFKMVLNNLDALFDFIFIDCPAGVDEGFHMAVCGADEAIVVTTPHIAAIRDADKVISILNSYALTSVMIVVNRLRGDLIKKGMMLSSNQVASVLKRFLIGAVPEDDYMAIFTQLGRIDLNKYSSYKAVSYMADYLLKGKLNFLNLNKQNIFKRIFLGGK